MNNDLANAMIIIGCIWTLSVLILGKHMNKAAKPLLVFAGGFCLGIAVAIYVL